MKSDSAGDSDPSLNEPLTSQARVDQQLPTVVILKPLLEEEDVERHDASEIPSADACQRPPAKDDEPDYVKRLIQIPLVGHLLVLVACVSITASAALIKVSLPKAQSPACF